MTVRGQRAAPFVPSLRIVPKILRNVFSQLRQIARDGPPIYLLIFAGNRRYQFRGSGIIKERIGEVVADPILGDLYHRYTRI